jgi:hypothetical protein
VQALLSGMILTLPAFLLCFLEGMIVFSNQVYLPQLQTLLNEKSSFNLEFNYVPVFVLPHYFTRNSIIVGTFFIHITCSSGDTS